MDSKPSQIIHLKTLKSYLWKYKKRIVLVCIGAGGVYFLYKKFLAEKVDALREIYQKMSDYNEVMNLNSNYENISKQYENSFSNLLNRLLEDIKQKVENQFSLKECFKALQSSPKEELAKMWILFKNKAFVSCYSSIFITRCMMLLSQTHLLILEKQTLENNSPKSFYEDLLNDLWLLAVDFIDYLTKYLENKLIPLAEEINIKHPISKERFLEFFRSMKDRIEETKVDFNKNACSIHLVIFEKYFQELHKKIHVLRKSPFTNDLKSMRVSSFLKFYQTYYDVITSNLFQVILIKALDYDFTIIEDSINLNFENEKKNNMKDISVPKIASFIYRMYNQMMDPDHTIFLIKNYKENKFSDELNEYFKIIYDK